jgi:Tol biopolymer transport system component/DNA-binding winged helix-turn-helix (wHTH) protein
VAARYRWDDFVLDLDTYRIERGGVPLALEPKAFNLLVLMVRQPGHLFTKQEIFDAVWPDTAVTDHALTRVVAQLRRVLGDEAREARYIETVPTRGYRWIPAVSEDEAPDGRGHRDTEDTENDSQKAAGRAALEGPRRQGPLLHVFPALAAALVVVIAMLAIALWTQRDTPTSASATADRDPRDVRWPVQVTTNPGLDLHPTLSPLGDAIAYVSDRSGGLEIYVRAFGGTATETALTSDGGQNVQPAWSPDGRFIAFHSYRRGGVWIVPARGGIPRQLAPTGSHPAWSPDGRQIAFQSDEHADVTPSAFGAQNGSTLWIVGADGEGLRQLTRTGGPIGGHAAPTWTRDGRYIAFAVFEGASDNGVWLLNVASGATTALVRGAGLYELVFAPDGSALYAAGGEPAILRFPFDAASGTITGPRETIPVPGVPGVRGLTIAADGSRLGFAGLSLNSQIWAQPVDRDGRPTAPARPLTTDIVRRNSLPAASPDGSKVAYMSTRGGELPNVWVIAAEGGTPLQVTSDETADFKPLWLGDSRRLVYFSNRSQQQGLWTVDIETRREELLFEGKGAAQSQPTIARGARLAEFDFAPKTRRVAISVVTPPEGRRVMYVGAIDGFAPRQLTDGARSVGYPSWSPEERRIAVEIKDGSSTHAGVIDVETGTLTQLTSTRGQTWVRSWSPDGRKVALAALRDGVWSLQWVDVESKRLGIITPASPPHVYVRYPEWSPRGDRVFFERGELRGNIWTLSLR